MLSVHYHCHIIKLKHKCQVGVILLELSFWHLSWFEESSVAYFKAGLSHSSLPDCANIVIARPSLLPVWICALLCLTPILGHLSSYFFRVLETIFSGAQFTRWLWTPSATFELQSIFPVTCRWKDLSVHNLFAHSPPICFCWVFARRTKCSSWAYFVTPRLDLQ